MNEQIKLEVDELIKNFQKAGEEIKNTAMKAVERTCIKVENDAKLRAPVLTGRLRRSITHRVKNDNGDIVGQIGTNVEYAAIVEFGSSEEWQGTFRGRGGKYKKGKLYNKTFKGKIAKPYLYPALKDNEYEIKNIIANALKGLLKDGTD